LVADLTKKCSAAGAVINDEMKRALALKLAHPEAKDQQSASFVTAMAKHGVICPKALTRLVAGRWPGR
jgi:hypothetical protein